MERVLKAESGGRRAAVAGAEDGLSLAVRFEASAGVAQASFHGAELVAELLGESPGRHAPVFDMHMHKPLQIHYVFIRILHRSVGRASDILIFMLSKGGATITTISQYHRIRQ